MPKALLAEVQQCPECGFKARMQTPRHTRGTWQRGSSDRNAAGVSTGSELGNTYPGFPPSYLLLRLREPNSRGRQKTRERVLSLSRQKRRQNCTTLPNS